MIFLYFLISVLISPSFYNLTLTVSTGWVKEPAQMEATPARAILRIGLFSPGPVEFMVYLYFYVYVYIYIYMDI